MVRDYFKMVVFYFLELVGSLVNLLCALFSYYPRFEFGVSFMLWIENKRVIKDNREQAHRRQKAELQANSTKEEAAKADKQEEEAPPEVPEQDPNVTDSNMIMPTAETPFPSIAARIRRPR